MRAYLINPEECTITEIEYSGDWTDISPMLSMPGDSIRTFDCARFNDEGDAVFVDDEGLMYEPPKPLFMISGYPAPLAGRGLVLGCDMSTGKSQSPSVDLKWLEENVVWVINLRREYTNADQDN